MSHPCWIGFRNVTLDLSPTLQGVERVRVVDVDHDVELLGKAGADVIACAIGLRVVYDADRPLEPRRRQGRAQRLLPEAQREAFEADVVKQPLVAARERGSNAALLGRRIPVARGGDGPGVRGEADEAGVVTELLA